MILINILGCVSYLLDGPKNIDTRVQTERFDTSRALFEPTSLIVRFIDR